MNAHGASSETSRPEVEEGTGNRGGEEGKEQGDRNREPLDPIDELIARVRSLVTFQCSREGDDEITPTVEELVTEFGLHAVATWLTDRPSRSRYRYVRDLATALRRTIADPAPTAPRPPVYEPTPPLTAEEQAEADAAFQELIARHRPKHQEPTSR